MGCEYVDDSSQQYVTVLHSSTHPLLGLRGLREDATMETLESFAKKTKLYRNSLCERTTVLPRTAVKATETTVDALRRMRIFTKRGDLNDAYSALEREHDRLQRALEDAVIDDEVGAVTNRIHRDICRVLNIQGNNCYRNGTEFTHALTIAVYEAREAGSLVLLQLPITQLGDARRVIKSQRLEKQITLSPVNNISLQERN